MEKEWGFKDLCMSFQAIWKNKLFILLATVFTGLVGMLVTWNIHLNNKYESKVSIYRQINSTTNTGVTLDDFVALLSSKNVSENITSQLAIEENLSWEDIEKNIKIEAISNNIVMVTVYNENAELDVQLTNAVATALVQEAERMSGNLELNILDTATKATLYSKGSIRLWRLRLIFAAIGLVISILYIFISDIFSKRVRSLEQCYILNKDEIYAVIPKMDIK